MPRKNQPPGPAWQVILEEIRSQNRSTIEAVDATRVALEQRIESLDRDTRSRDAVLEAAIQESLSRVSILEAAIQRLDQDTRSRDASLEVAIGDLKVSVQQNSVDIRDLAGKVEALGRLEQRVSALEQPRP